MIKLIVAMDEDNLIGSDSANGLPWKNAEDLKHFKETTLNQAVVFGGSTYRAMGRSLKNRHNIIISRTIKQIEGARIVDSLETVIKEYQQNNEDLYICGGASIYQQALPFVDELLISRIPGHHEGNVWFPDFSSNHFVLKEIKPYETFKLEIYSKGQ